MYKKTVFLWGSLMRMKISCIILALSLTAPAAWGEPVSESSDSHLKLLESRAAEVKSGKAAELAEDALKEALAGVASVQAASAGGNQKLARQKSDMSYLLLDVAESKAAKRELLEQVALKRAELKKLEVQLEKNLKGGDK
jgi:hypothetical protein